jgi:hypothetical protein
MSLNYLTTRPPRGQHDTFAFQPSSSQLSDWLFGGTSIVIPDQSISRGRHLFLTSVDECDYLYSLSYEGNQTADQPAFYDNDFRRLQLAYEHIVHNEASNSLFTEAVATLDWCNKPAWFFKQAIGLALQLELSTIAHKLTSMGCELYPGDADLKRAERVLAPPKVIETARPSRKGLSESMAWLQHHAVEYRGVWVALEAGELIGTAPSRDVLVRELGERGQRPGILITRIS